jgi:2-polyprenyl-6-hydroxyphenyl methylase/3-demethylubiquinone-9 3-methyltransferase
LEHIQNWDAVIAEITRVLKDDGIFLFDTINRTVLSKLFIIKMAQHWQMTRFLPQRLHVWEMFIKPEELKNSLERHGLHQKDSKGTKPTNPLPVLHSAYNFNRGKLSIFELAERLRPSEGSDLSSFYMGYAVKV